MPAPDYIDLAVPRIVVIRQGQNTYRFTIPPIAEARWFKYFDGIKSEAERDGKTIVQRVDASSAGLELVDAVMTESTSKSLAHRLAVANVLTSAYAVSEDEPDAHAAGSEAIRIHAVWSADDGDKMRRYKNLVHFFDSPTAEQYRRFKRDDSRAQVISGSRKGVTVYHGAQKTLAALYDELIVSVAGYASNGTLLEGRDQIARTMDTYHKVAAALQLFSPANIEVEDEIDEDDR